MTVAKAPAAAAAPERACIVTGCDRPGFDKEGYCRKHGWQQVVLRYMETPAAKMLVDKLPELPPGQASKIIRDAMFHAVDEP